MIDFKGQTEAFRLQTDLFRKEGKAVFATSSFQSGSVVLLHLLGCHAPDIPVYFLNTGYLFPETLSFRDALSARFGLDIRTLRSPLSRSQQCGSSGRFLFASDPDRCCHMNKVAPLEPVIARSDVWISGVRASQSETRAKMKRLQPTGEVLRYHPLLEWDARMVHFYIEQNGLPRHPLEEEGYMSIGCRPCTRRWTESLDSRQGRWAGLNKTECGLHTSLGTGK
jgi:phosphoadenosine phosphosulfate reductase